MPLEKAQKSALIEKFRTHENDTGSPDVQIAMLTERINQLTAHLKTHRHDYHSQRGLLMLVGQRRRLLNYLARHHHDRYRQVVTQLGLRR